MCIQNWEVAFEVSSLLQPSPPYLDRPWQTWWGQGCRQASLPFCIRARREKTHTVFSAADSARCMHDPSVTAYTTQQPLPSHDSRSHQPHVQLLLIYSDQLRSSIRNSVVTGLPNRIRHPVTWNFQPDLDSVKVKQHPKCLGQKSFHFKIIVVTHWQTYTEASWLLYPALKWSLKIISETRQARDSIEKVQCKHQPQNTV